MVNSDPIAPADKDIVMLVISLGSDTKFSLILIRVESVERKNGKKICTFYRKINNRVRFFATS